MEQKIVQMIEDCGLEVSDVKHLVEAIETQAKQQVIGQTFDQLLKAFDVQIGNEQQARSDVLKADNGQKTAAWWAHNGRVDGVDTGRALVEIVMTEIEESHTAKPMGKGYIATAEIDEEEIGYFGEGGTPAAALKWFDVNEYISVSGLESGDVVEIGVFKAIYNGSEEWKQGEYRDEFAWVLGERVDTKLITVNLDESESK